MYKIVIMNGKPCSGKTTFEELCGIFCTTYLYSTIDPIKEVAKKVKKAIRTALTITFVCALSFDSF